MIQVNRSFVAGTVDKLLGMLENVFNFSIQSMVSARANKQLFPTLHRTEEIDRLFARYCIISISMSNEGRHVEGGQQACLVGKPAHTLGAN